LSVCRSPLADPTLRLAPLFVDHNFSKETLGARLPLLR